MKENEKSESQLEAEWVRESEIFEARTGVAKGRVKKAKKDNLTKEIINVYFCLKHPELTFIIFLTASNKKHPRP